VHVNNWLVEHGYLVPKEITKSSTAKYVHTYVDWSKTKAYSMGLGTVYLNLKGREPKGIVEPSEKREVMEAIRRDFLASEDPDAPGTKIGSDVEFAEDVHSGPHLDLDADMLFCFAPTYRSSWASAMGEFKVVKDPENGGRYVAAPTVVPSDKNWSGDHVSVDPDHVRGIFFSNLELALPAEGVNLLHVAPTALALLGLEVPEHMDMPALARK
jgi:predicted AlkP superfamily phosphohydrolase/phosphomutase